MNLIRIFKKKENRENPHFYLMLFWILMSVPTVLWWKESILWLAILSLYANVEASAAALEAHK